MLKRTDELEKVILLNELKRRLDSNNITCGYTLTKYDTDCDCFPYELWYKKNKSYYRQDLKKLPLKSSKYHLLGYVFESSNGDVVNYDSPRISKIVFYALETTKHTKYYDDKSKDSKDLSHIEVCEINCYYNWGEVNLRSSLKQESFVITKELLNKLKDYISIKGYKKPSKNIYIDSKEYEKFNCIYNDYNRNYLYYKTEPLTDDYIDCL